MRPYKCIENNIAWSLEGKLNHVNEEDKNGNYETLINEITVAFIKIGHSTHTVNIMA